MESNNNRPYKRILVLADFACATGFAQVAQNIVSQLLKETEIQYQIDIVGINYFGIPNEWQDLYPQVRLFPANLISNGDVFGRNGFLNMLATGAYDLAWILQDTFNIEPIAQTMVDIRTSLATEGKKPFKFVFYYPIDAKPKENWITKSVSLADVPVVYTKYGYEESVAIDPTLKDRLLIAPHGIDVKAFHPVDDKLKEEFKHHYFEGNADGKFLVTNVNRNQPRKDIARTLQIFSIFKRQAPEALLYLHMKRQDVAYDLAEVARQYELIPDKDYIIPANFSEHDGVSVEVMNLIYNASDVIMTTTLGEGWGLSMTEAMATKTPVIAPNHTSLTEMLADGRGTLVKAGRTQSDWFVMANDNERFRPLTDIADYVDKLAWIRNHYPEAKEMAESAYTFVHNNWTWDIVGAQWRQIVENAFPQEKQLKVGRNDPCPCGSGKKFKKCHMEVGNV